MDEAPDTAGQRALLTWRDATGRMWLSAAVLTPLRSIADNEERPYGTDVRLVGLKLVEEDAMEYAIRAD